MKSWLAIMVVCSCIWSIRVMGASIGKLIKHVFNSRDETKSLFCRMSLGYRFPKVSSQTHCSWNCFFNKYLQRQLKLLYQKYSLVYTCILNPQNYYLLFYILEFMNLDTNNSKIIISKLRKKY